MTIPDARHLRITYLSALVLFIVAMLTMTFYTVKTLRDDAIQSGFERAGMLARGFEDMITSSLQATETLATSVLNHAVSSDDTERLNEELAAILRQSPYLRSISLLDRNNTIIASTNNANEGISLPDDEFMPKEKSGTQVLRIGQPWVGRDFATGSSTSHITLLSSNAHTFIPVIKRISNGYRSVSILVALNPGYFVDYFVERLNNSGSVDVLRYDGSVLLSSDPNTRIGSSQATLVNDERMNDRLQGFIQHIHNEKITSLCAYRASRLFPFIVLTHLDENKALAAWRQSTQTLILIVVPALLAVTLLGLHFLRRQITRAEIREKMEHLQRINATVFDASEEAILITGTDTHILSVNSAFCRTSGYAPEEVIGRHLTDFLDTYSIELLEKLPHTGLPIIRTNHDTPHPCTPIEVRFRPKADGLLWMEILSTPVIDQHGGIAGYRRIVRNITDRKTAESQLQLAASVFTHAREGIFITDPLGIIIDVNDAFCDISGFSREDVLGKTPRLFRSEKHDRDFYTSLWTDITQRGFWHGEIWNRHKNGQLLAELMTISAVRDDCGKISRFVALFTDITALKEQEKELLHIAHFDALTGLPNRILLADRLQHAMNQAQRNGKPLAVAFLDLDGFKAINDEYGHDAGDQLLIIVSTRMKLALREVDTLARLGGDEFVAVLQEMDSPAACEHTVQRLLSAASHPIDLNGHRVQVSASVGVAFYPIANQSIEADQLIRHADQAMYSAKIAGKNRFCFFDNVPGGNDKPKDDEPQPTITI